MLWMHRLFQNIWIIEIVLYVYDMRFVNVEYKGTINSWDQDKTFKGFYHPKKVLETEAMC